MGLLLTNDHEFDYQLIVNECGYNCSIQINPHFTARDEPNFSIPEILSSYY